jgi:quinol-cytochrome oxidoreductase complex cytochrome b subunit
MGFTMALLPIFDRKPERRISRRPVAAVLGGLFFAGFVVLWLVGRQVTTVEPGARLRPGDVPEQTQPAGVKLDAPNVNPEDSESSETAEEDQVP